MRRKGGYGADWTWPLNWADVTGTHGKDRLFSIPKPCAQVRILPGAPNWQGKVMQIDVTRVGVSTTAPSTAIERHSAALPDAEAGPCSRTQSSAVCMCRASSD
jgi:hypothetical protein